MAQGIGITLAKQTEYVALNGTRFVAFFAFYAVSKGLSRDQTFNALTLLVVSEVCLGLVRFLNFGLEVRTGLGFSYLAPLLLAMTLLDGRKGLMKAPGRSMLVMFSIFVNLISGMRSVVIICTAVYAGIVLILITRGHNLVRARLLIFFGCAALSVLGVMIVAPNLYEHTQNIIAFVLNRAYSTLLAEGGMALDPEGSHSRVEEAMLALSAVKWEAAPIFQIMFGVGGGLLYATTDGVQTGHIHITPISILVKYGVLGFSLYWMAVAMSIYGVIKNFLSKRLLTSVAYLVIVSAWVVSFFSGVLISPATWIYLGFAYGFAANKNIS